MLHLFQSQFFRHLSLEVLATIARGAEVRVYRKGGTVCRTGERSDRIFVICQESADVLIEEDGKSKWINVVADGDSVGELGVFAGHPRAATVRINKDNSRLIAIDDEVLMSVLGQDAKTAVSFLELLSSRQQAMLARMSRP